MTPAQLSALPEEPLSPRESMLTAMRRFERASLLDAFQREYRRANRYRLALWLSWAAVGIVVTWRSL